ncbi:hypothetical protein KR009_009856 [Drosophila setifemur]|nr:hypothetical protein KR009_009856 [Drosophila setifemur]
MWKPLCAMIIVILASVEPGTAGRRLRREQAPNLNLEDYQTYESVMQYLEQMARTYSTRMYLKDAGRSYEQRQLKLAVIGNGDGRPGKRTIFLDATLHSREWLCPSAALNVIHQLVVNYKENAKLLLDYDWVILPLANPDGYEYSRRTHYMWRNTRSPNVGNCLGTNLNRNFDITWGQGFPDLRDPCSEQYAGKEAFSESEARTVRDIMQGMVNSQRGVMYLSLHTANRSIFYPWVHNGHPTNNNQELMEIARFAADSVYSTTGTVIKPKQGYNYGGVISGTSLDYAYQLGFPLAFVFEMSGMGKDQTEYKFFPPPWFIRDLVAESWVGIRALAEKAIEKYPPSRKMPQFRNTMNVNNASPTSLSPQMAFCMILFSLLVTGLNQRH